MTTNLRPFEITAGPAARPGALEVDIGAAVPSAYVGIRRALAALHEATGSALDGLRQKHPAEWAKLFPGSLNNAPDISDLALSPSERRLHRESEQTFWVANFAAQALLEGVRALNRPLVLRNAGQADLVSLRCVMRAAEWSRMKGPTQPIVLSDYLVERQLGGQTFTQRRRDYLSTIAKRLRAPMPEGQFVTMARSSEPVVDDEGRYLQVALDHNGSVEQRLAASVLAVRAAFFTTNYEGAFLAIENGLALLDKVKDRIDVEELHTAWDALDNTRLVSPAIEIDGDSLGDGPTMRTLLLRSLGVVRVFVGMHDEALDAFARGIEASPSPEGKGHLHMFRALMLIKRLNSLDDARREVNVGLSWLEKAGKERALHEGWLRNVSALVHFQRKELDLAVKEEKVAIKCVGDLHSPSATHLKINLISNLSVVQETAKAFEDSIGTWRRFEKISEKWGANFRKHHSYRLAGLTLGAGRSGEALEHYGHAYHSAEELGDTLHRQVIAAEQGRQALEDGRRGQAEEWFAKAEAHARELGDPLKVAESLAGQAVARKSTDFAAVVQMAEASSTYPKESSALLKALSVGTVDAVQAQLPKPRTKLNRPFDQVNL